MTDDDKAGCAASPRPGECPALSLMTTAYHEAAHAVISYATWPQQPVESVSIIPNDYSLGRVEHAGQDEEWREECEDERMADAMATESRTVICLAGYMAAAHFRGDHVDVPLKCGQSSDSSNAHYCASATWDGDTDELHHIALYAGKTYEIVQRPSSWLAIVRMAGALLRQLQLSGKEVEAIVEEAGVEPDPWRVPLFYREDPDDEAFSWERW